MSHMCVQFAIHSKQYAPIHNNMWPDLGKPSVWDQREISAMRAFSNWGRKLSNFCFCYILVLEPF